MHQEFYGTHLGTFGGQSNLHISKTMHFIFSQNTPPSHLPKLCHTDQLGHVQNTPNWKHSCTKNFMVHIWGHLEANPSFTSQTPWISFFHKTLHQAIYLSRGTPINLAMCKTHRTQNIHAPRNLGYSFGDIWGHSNLHISKTMNFIFFTKTIHQAICLCRAISTNLAMCKKTPNSKHRCTKNFMVLIWGHLEAIPTFTSQKPWISYFHKTLHQAYLSRATPTNLAMCKTHWTQYIRAPRILCYSFGDIWRPIQPSHLKNHEFRFFTKYPTKPST